MTAAASRETSTSPLPRPRSPDCHTPAAKANDAHCLPPRPSSPSAPTSPRQQWPLALAALSDPATLTWLLCLISDQDTEGKPIAEHCAAELRALAQGPYLTIRAIARRLLPPSDAATLPLGPSDASPLTSPGSALWVPEASDDDDDAPTELVRGVAGARLIDAESLVPGLAEAVLRRVARDYASPELRSRMKDQLRAYRDTSIHDCWPDAYLAIEQAVEETLQRTAAGSSRGPHSGRTAIR